MAATYEVVSIEPTTILGPANRPARGQLITFVTVPSKITGELRVADADATPDAVHEQITARAAQLEAIKAL